VARVVAETEPPWNWIEHQAKLLSMARRQLFFIGGAPRSGTTWLQHLLDSHPDVCCRGEGFFKKHLAEPIEAMMIQRRHALEAKNDTLFRHSGGYPLPGQTATDLLVGTGILLALEQQCMAKPYLAVGEKTPENVFFFQRLKCLFPNAKFIGIARDPRDVLTSAWHFFHKRSAGENETEAKIAFIRSAFLSIDRGARTMLALKDQYPSDCLIVTYEHMLQATPPVAAELFRFLGVSDDGDVVADCVARTSFAALSGRTSGPAQDGSFFRAGAVRDWRSTLTSEMSDMILQELGWMFPRFEWLP
jgi:Sulfotransferase family